MEAIILDESMELAPDTARYFDPHDDIEIDLDEVGAPNHDNDVIVDDASMAGSDQAEIMGGTHEPVKDADMVDDSHGTQHVEDSHKQAEEDYQFVDDALDIDNQSYEMEDDYEEDIDAPIPGTGVMEPDLPGNGAPSAEMAEGGYNGLEDEPTGPVEPSVHPEVTEQNMSLVPKEGSENSGILPAEEQEQVHEVNLGAGEPDQVNLTSDEQPQNAEHLEAEEPVSGVKSPVKEIAPETLDEGSNRVAEEAAVPRKSETGAQESEASILHNVQVLYQDSEISLFPPKEDDLSETYFLEDEALADEPIGDLLNACRVVLGDHMGTEEELYMEIECLGLHLTEAVHPPISLSQIVQVYLDLCRNDGDTNPGPLYITLATQPSFTQNFNTLSEAAQSGKGLSYVGKWDEYEDQIVSEEHENTESQNAEEPEDTENGEKDEETEASAHEPSTPKSQPEVNHEEDNKEGNYVNEGIEINANETEYQEAQPVPAEAAIEAEVSDAEANQTEQEDATHESFPPDDAAQQEVTGQNLPVEKVEEPSFENTQENAQSPIPDNEGGESSVPHISQDTNTEPAHESVTDAHEDFIEIDLEAFDEESHKDDDDHVDGGSSHPSHEQAAEPSTPEPSYNPLEVDEDIFKSPTAAEVELPNESSEDHKTDRLDEVAYPTETYDENQIETILREGRNNDEDTTSAIPVEEGQAQDFNAIEVVDSATGETLSNPSAESKEPEVNVEGVTFPGSAEMEADWHHDAPENRDLVDPEEEPYQTELLDGEYLEARNVAENAEVAASNPEPESNGTAQNGADFQEQSPKAGKRPRVDDEPTSMPNTVPVIKKPRSE
ncbi:conserved glutamic acid-rich protein [Trichophyton verrucosum HKI 0517]|uniref:Conserved glutamic acid-rich protein n=1 Tax=Trichophyton verrucosum (strain HKI 0517) TaxID=663202 RepID=D4DJ82_TRIVH|nr:conserved glutamic acid-rich protein [Trichophyton verrucosum HKI 0517]EFE38098.1 conserved glutamic acid-rich protein [Trichophyton verrucosum HKI 0517]